MTLPPDQQPRFPRPPTTADDNEGRTITVEAYDGDADPLVEMYGHFEEASRSQGLPPRSDSRTREWLEGLLEKGLNTIARHGEDVVGHAVLVPSGELYELAIFVRPEYQAAGIGTQLIRGLLGQGQENGVGHVWLTVSRSNRIAMNLYWSAGFETTASGRGEHEMELVL
ncbi:GNAT family N-acetyltransferase [Natronococcus occultus]|uniref:Acetyltransferase n=1 Tax=Natronococcus occultus SP4 TaxID=694430 RepID=L0JYC3_9EURY|nr:GNAT family N-acetyltransferase [Natronococcus occultus]AGB36838.1 acetyltransferase [Natronococcus occultus SP4]